MSKPEKSDSKPKSKLDEDTLSYFKRVENVIEDDEFDDDEAKQLFVENVFSQIEGNEVTLACDQALSRILEKLIEYFTDIQMKIMWKNMAKDFKTITTDCYGSHVVQRLVNRTPKTIRTERNQIKDVKRSEPELDSIEQLFSNYCNFVRENLKDLVRDTYGSHVLRAMLEVLGGVRVDDSVQRSRYSRGCRTKAFKMDEGKYGKVHSVGQAYGNTQLVTPPQSIAVPESFVSSLEGLTASLVEMDLCKLVMSHLSCPVLQTLLLVLHEKDAKLCSKLCKKIMNQMEVDNTADLSLDGLDDSDNKDGKTRYCIPALLTHDVGSHLVEKVLHVVSPHQHKKFFKRFFRGHLSELSLHAVGNYILQHLLATTTNPTLAEQMIDELLGEMEEIFSTGHDGVIARMAELCVRLEVKQKEFKQAILEAFHCAGKKERTKCATLIFSMTTYDVFYGNEKDEEKEIQENGEEMGREKANQDGKTTLSLKTINFHGAILLKTILNFKKPKVFVESIISMSSEELLRVCKDLIGSRTLEALLNSETVTTEQKNQLSDSLQGRYSMLSCDKNSSHVVESCWRKVDSTHKERIVQELAKEKHKLSKDFFASKVLRNCGIDTSKGRAKEWGNTDSKSTRKRQNFQGVFQDGEAKKTKEDTKKKKSDVQKYAAEMAVLGFDQPIQDLIKESTKTDKNKLKKRTEDDIDIIFRSTKLSKHK